MALGPKKTENYSKIGQSKTFEEKDLKNKSCFPTRVDFDPNVKTIN